ncbi:MAG TPA: hypothetical protein VGG89_03785 [Candidatus Baltobacteraceae bacterium]
MAQPPATQQGTLPQVEVTAPLQSVNELTRAPVLAYYAAKPVRVFAELPNIETNQGTFGIVLWGTRDAKGDFAALTEAQVFGGNDGLSAHIFFDSQMQPVLFRDDASGYSLAIVHDSPQRTAITLCDPQFSPVSSIALDDATPLTQTANAGGTCSLRNADAVQAAYSAATCTLSPEVAAKLCSLSQLIMAGNYVAGLTFAVAAILAHENKTQTPLSTPITFIFVAAALIFAPSVFKSAGGTLYGETGETSAVEGIMPFYQAQESLPGCSGTAPAGNCPFPSPEPTPA